MSKTIPLLKTPTLTVVQRAFSALVKHGRLPLGLIAKYADLPVRHVRHALVVLIQQHLVLHYTPPDDSFTIYEAHVEHAYALLRAGKIVQLLEQRYGEDTADIVSNLLLLGHTKIGDLEEAYGLKNKKRNVARVAELANGDATTNGANGHSASEHPIKTLGQLHERLQLLIRTGYAIPVTKRHFYPPSDIKDEATEEVLKANPKFREGTKGPKKQIEFQRELRKVLTRWRGQDSRTGKSSSTGEKRVFDVAMFEDRPNKRRKVNGGVTKGGSVDSGSISDEEVDRRGPILDVGSSHTCTLRIR
jgi:DNA-directed RNA polymerase III subunit RPC3